MKKRVIKIIDNNWFFVSLVLFAVVLPLSQALVSICSGIIFLTALIEDNWKNKLNRFRHNKVLLTFPAIFLIYVLSSLVSNKFSASLYDLQKSLFYLVIPVSFIFGKSITNQQKRFVFYSFAVSIAVSTIITVFNWKFSHFNGAFSVHEASLISHIRFSFQLILAFWFFELLIQKNFRNFSNRTLILLLFVALYFLTFLLFQQSLTGLIALTGSIVFYLVFLLFKISSGYRFYLSVFVILLIVAPVVYVVHAVHKFYNFEKVDKNNLETKTAQGNLYQHNLNSPMVENGNYVYLYVCPEELREEWNKISELKYDSVDVNGYPVSQTLIRYLTSKGLRKDAEGVKSLDKEDIQNVENGIANVIYANDKFSLYPRIYETIWEYYTYSKTGNANKKSFSQRIEYAKAAISIIKQNLWVGVGTGNWKEEFKKAYERNNPKLMEENYASSHNQYLNYMVKFGIIGFCVIYFLILFPVFQTKRYEDLLFILFLVFMFIANFGDSNFESHMGSSFFVFFYCLFIIGGDNYLKLLWVENK